MTYDWRSIQSKLTQLGFSPGPIDGVVGPKTEAAISAFKRSIGFNPRPYYGPLTHEALMGAPTSSDIPWMAEAIRMKGLHEQRDKSALRLWFDKSVTWIDPSATAWCGAFVATVLRKWEPSIALPANPLGARAWGIWGKSCVPQLGAVMVFWRGSKSGWQGHVGFYWGEDDDAYHILGGNQSDAVTITRMSKSRFIGARWPADFPQLNKVIKLTSAGKPLSTNEA